MACSWLKKLETLPFSGGEIKLNCMTQKPRPAKLEIGYNGTI